MANLIFDCDGVLADTERDGHRPAFNAMFAELGVPARWDVEEYGRRLRIGGGKERMASLFDDPGFAESAGVPDDEAGRAELLATWHRAKGAHFRRLVAEGAMPPRPGITRIIIGALDAGWTVAVASTSAEESVRAVLEHAVGEAYAARVPLFAGDVVAAKKPDPAVYLLAVSSLGLDPADTLVVEDSRNGLRAAVAAGLRCLVTVSSYTGDEDFSEAALVVSELGDPDRPPIEVLADRAGVHVGDLLTLDDLRAVLSSQGSPAAAPARAAPTRTPAGPAPAGPAPTEGGTA